MIHPGYTIIDEPGSGLLLIDHPDYGTQLWGRGRTTYKHSGDACILCGRIVRNIAYRPVGNPGNRMLRICDYHRKPQVTP